MQKNVISDDLISKFMFQRRPYITIADSLNCIRNNFLATTGLEDYRIVPFDYTLVKNEPSGGVSYRWVLGYDELKFNHILSNKPLYKNMADLVYSNISQYPKSKLAKYYWHVLKNIDTASDIDILTAVFHLTYRFIIPEAFNVHLIHKYHLEKKSDYYRARLRIDLQPGLAGLPPLQIEDLEPQDQLSKKIYHTKYLPNEAFYMEWLAGIQGLEFYKEEYSYTDHLYFPIYDGILPNQRTLIGYIGMFFSDEKARQVAIDYFAPHSRYVFRNIDRSYKLGTQQNIIDSYREQGINENPISYWTDHLNTLHNWQGIQLEDKPSWHEMESYSVQNSTCTLSIGKLLERTEILSIIDPDFFEDHKNYILILKFPNELVDVKSLTKYSSYVINRIREIVQLLDQLLQTQHELISEEKTKNAARKSAVSAVMSRNMSHNLGSHVLARLCSEGGFSNHTGNGRLKHITTLNSYMRTRMDFLADLSTTSSAIVTPLRLYRDTLGYLKPTFLDQEDFHWQELLMDYISGSTDLQAQNIDIQIYREGSKINLERIDQDPVFSSPNGLFGVHALYVIIENIIRNSAKHGFTSEKHKKLVINIEVSEADAENDLMKICIFDNLCDSRKAIRITRKKIPLLDYVNEKIDQSILDKNGVLRGKAWGILEMKICAAYLRSMSASDLDDLQSPDLLRAVDKQGNLGYEFYLQVPHEILIVDELGKITDAGLINKKLQRQGIRIISKKTFFKELQFNIRYSFMILIDPGSEFVKTVRTNSNALPLRIFTTSQTCIHFPYIAFDLLYAELKRPVDGIHSLMLKVWKCWHAEKFPRVALFIRPEDDELVKKWSVKDVAYASTNPAAITPLAPDRQYVILDRHGEIHRQDRENLERKFQSDEYIYYERVSHKQPTYFVINHARTNHHLDSGIIYKLIESGATKIIVLDERIQKVADETQEYGIPLGEILQNMNIHIPERSHIDLDNVFKFSRALTRWLLERLHTVDFLIVHLGIIERIYAGNERKMEARIRSIEKKYPNLNVILVSGRGVPSAIRTIRSRFIQYSQVARFILEERSKYHLCKVLFAARRSTS